VNFFLFLFENTFQIRQRSLSHKDSFFDFKSFSSERHLRSLFAQNGIFAIFSENMIRYAG